MPENPAALDQHDGAMRLTAQHIRATLPKRLADAHKGMHGDVAIVGGDRGMTGAVVLASRAALLAGAGRTYASFFDPAAPSLDVLYPEIMVRAPEELRHARTFGCVVLGPGMGLSLVAAECMRYWLEQETPVLLDADALNLMARDSVLAHALRVRRSMAVITPHPGEAARVWGQRVEESQRLGCARSLADRLQVVCVLKGPQSVIAHPDGRVCINTTGNPGLASGGTGDVLSGIVGSLMAQGLSSFDAACAGVYLHGAAADALVARGVGPVGLTASEVALEVRAIINRLHALSEVKLD